MRIGLIGCGEIARRGHLPALRALKDFRVEALADQDENRARQVAREFGIATAYGSAPELIHDPAVAAVVAAVPPQAYKDIVSLAADCGKPLLLEKPLAVNLADAQCIVRTVKESGIKAGVVQNYRYFAAIGDIKRRLDSGRLGNPVSIHLWLHQHFPLSWSLSPWRFEGPHGVLTDLGGHAFDILLWLAGSEPESVFAFGGSGLPGASFLSQVSALLRFPGGLTGLVDLSWLTGPMAFQINILGTGGRLISDILFNQVNEQHGTPLPLNDVASLARKLFFTLRGAITGDLFLGPLRFYRYLYRDFARYVEGNNSDFPSVEAALKTVKITQAVAQSLATASIAHP